MSGLNEVDQLFDELMKRHESDTLDFKAELYDFTTAAGRDTFAKDVICMANTPRTIASYIVCGVKYSAEQGAVPVGLARQEDGARFTDHLNERNVQPRPTIRYVPVCREGKMFGIIEIPIQKEVGRPFLPARELTGMQRYDLWVRRDSQNAKANADEMMRIYSWFSTGVPAAATPTDTSGQWDKFLETARSFESGRHFVLIADPLKDASRESHAGFGLVPWVAVADFDPQSEVMGLLAATRANIEQRRSLQVVVKGQGQPVYPHGGTAWFFARGLAGRETTLQTGPYRAWLARLWSPARRLGPWCGRRR